MINYSNNFNFSTLVELLRYRALHQPSQIAFTFLQDGEIEEASLTYQELDKQSRAIAAQLQSVGMSGERALLLYPPGLDFIAAFFGCLYAEVVAVPTYPPRNYRHTSRILAIVADAQAAIALTSTTVLSNLRFLLSQTTEPGIFQWLATDSIASGIENCWQRPDVNTDTLALLQYTSGSTGIPKGVMLSHGNLLHNSALIHQCFEDTPDSRGVSWLPPYHDMGLIGGLLQPLYVGAPMTLMPPVAFLQRPFRWLQAVSHYKATTSGGPNFAYDLCARKITPEQRAGLDLSNWSLAFNGAEPIRRETLDSFIEAFEPYGFRREAFYPCYGLAEATLIVSGGLKIASPVVYSFQAEALEHNRVIAASAKHEGNRTLVGCGQSLQKQKIVPANPETLTRCMPNQVGEIWVSGPSVARGYWNRPKETEEAFCAYLADTGEGPFLRTGDLGFLKDSELFITGRLKDLIIIRGCNYYPQDIELTIEQSHPALRSNCGAVFSVEVDSEERLVLVQEIERHFRHLDLNGVFEAIRQAVTEQHGLQVYAILLVKTGSIPKTSSGKIQRYACRAGFLAGSLDVVEDWTENPRTKQKFRYLQGQVKSLLQQLQDTKQQKSSSGRKNFHKQAGLLKESQTAEAIQAWLVSQVSERLGVASYEIDVRSPFARYGLDSVTAISISGELEDWLGRQLSPTLVYDYPTIEALACYLAKEPDVTEPAPRIYAGQGATAEPIAIIGMGCRFPGGADSPEAFWQLLHNGIDAITEVPSNRWDVDAYYDPDPDTPGKMHTRWGGFIKHVDLFDPLFFGIAPHEVVWMDPQQRLLLEVAWEALENAGKVPDKLAGSQTGVFIGICSSDYSRLQLTSLNSIDAYAGTGNSHSIAANRLSYLLDLQGPSLAVDTACSSSLVAVHLACQSLHNGECDLALTGGVNLILSPELNIAFSQARMMAADGRCKTFDANADGYVRGEGCGIVVLKRFSDAIRDGDSILALIRGSSVNQDGRSNGLTAPKGPSQQLVIRQALANAGLAPSQISYVEAHGTGTPLGDPIEVDSLKTVLMKGRLQNQPCSFGSVKTNIGHLEAAAGIAGLIKVVLLLQNRVITPSLHLKQLNPHISLADTPFSITTERQPFSSNEQFFAGVSSFGFGGTNVHVVLAEAAVITPVTSHIPRPLQILTLSAKSENALQTMALRYEAFLTSHPQASVADICFTANTGRSHFPHRLALVAESTAQICEQLGAFATGRETPRLVSCKANSRKPPKVAFLFTGQGSQYVGMGRQLYETQPVFRHTLERCDEILQPYLEQPLLSVLYPATGESSFLDETGYTQPALFALEYALAELWQSWGINPAVVMGHSVGEYVAACVAGVFSLEDGLKLVAERARLMQALPQDGEMVSVFTDEVQVAAVIQPYVQDVSIAAINGPQNIVISGKRQAISSVVAALEAKGVKTKKLQVSHAFHSPLIEPMLETFEQATLDMTYSSPQIGLISNVTGELAVAEVATSEYWYRHTQQPVRFAAGMKTLHQQGCGVFLEIGPKPILLGMGRHCLPEGEGVWLPSLRQGQPDWQQLLQSLGKLYIGGVTVDWSGFDQDYPHRRLHLPTYPFQRQRYWVRVTGSESWRLLTSSQRKPTVFHPLLGKKLQSPLLKETVFESKFSTDNLPFLEDHRVYEKIVVPGGCFISLLLGATELTFGTRGCILENVLFPEALVILKEEVHTIQLVITPEDGTKASFKLISLEIGAADESSSWAVHMTGRVLTGEKEAATTSASDPFFIQKVQARCQQEIASTELYQALLQRQIRMGPSFQWICSIWRGDREALCQISLPQTLTLNDVEEYQLHPGLIDSCFQLLVAAVPTKTKETFVPFSIERFQFFHHPSSLRLWCHACLRQVKESKEEKLVGDIRLLDQTGQVIAEVIGLECRKMSRQTLLRSLQKDLGKWLYEIAWQPKAREHNPEPMYIDEPSSWLIFAEQGGIGVKLANIFRARGDRCVLIFAGQTYRMEEGEHYYLNPTDPQDFQRLLRDLETKHTASLKEKQLPYCGVVYLWSLEGTPSGQETTAALQNAQIVGCGGVLHLVQALTQAEWPKIPRLWLVTQGTHLVGPVPAPLQVQQAPLWGLGRVIAIEHPEIWGGLIDLDPSLSPDEVAMLSEEIRQPDGEDQFALRDGRRYVARLLHSRGQPTATESVQVRADSTYLITGGLGDLGLMVARWLVDRGARHLVLLGRTGASTTAMEAVRALELVGVQVVVAQADVVQASKLAMVLANVKRSMPPLRGIIHAAGVLDDGILLQQQWTRFAKVLAPKVEGAWNLHTLTQSMPLDFFALFSSAASLVGSPGQGNYAAANAFLDALAHYRQAQGLPALSINWGPWTEVGMATRSKKGRRAASPMVESIEPEQGLEVLKRLLHQTSPQVGVLPVRGSHWHQFYLTLNESPLLLTLLHEEDDGTIRWSQSRGKDGLTREALLTAEPEQRQRMLVTHLQEQLAHVLGLVATQNLDIEQPLNTMGLDSLMALQLKNGIETTLGIGLPVADLLQGPTLSQLTTQILKQLKASVDIPSERLGLAVSQSQDEHQDSDLELIGRTNHENPEQLLANLDQFSDEEVDSLLSSILIQEKVNNEY